jgi:hypothetical protein
VRACFSGCLANSRCPPCRGQSGGGARVNFSNYNKVRRTVHISHRGTRDRARVYVTRPRGNQYGWHVWFPVLDPGNQPYSVQTSVCHSTLTEVREMSVACTSSRRKHRRVDRDCTVQVHGGSWTT